MHRLHFKKHLKKILIRTPIPFFSKFHFHKTKFTSTLGELKKESIFPSLHFSFFVIVFHYVSIGAHEKLVSKPLPLKISISRARQSRVELWFVFFRSVPCRIFLFFSVSIEKKLYSARIVSLNLNFVN